MSSARYVQFNTKFTTRGSVVAKFGGRQTVRDAHSGRGAAGSLWPRPVSQAFCKALPPFDACLLCVCDSALSAPHSAACSINHPLPFFKGKILHLLYYFFTNSRFDISFKLSSVIRNVIAFISALGRKLYRFWMICATLFFTFYFQYKVCKITRLFQKCIYHITAKTE